MLPADLPKFCTDRLEYVASQLQTVRETVQQNQRDANAVSAKYYNQKTTLPTFTVGQKVLIKDERSLPGVYHKFRDRYRGFYTIEQVRPKFTYLLREGDSGKILKAPVHASKLRLYNTDRSEFYERCGLNEQTAAERSLYVQNDDVTNGDTVTPSSNAEHTNDQTTQPQQPVADPTDTNQFYEIDKIIRTRGWGKSREYLVQYKSDKSRAWVSKNDVNDVALDVFNKTRRRIIKSRR